MPAVRRVAQRRAEHCLSTRNTLALALRGPRDRIADPLGGDPGGGDPGGGDPWGGASSDSNHLSVSTRAVDVGSARCGVAERGRRVRGVTSFPSVSWSTTEAVALGSTAFADVCFVPRAPADRAPQIETLPDLPTCERRRTDLVETPRRSLATGSLLTVATAPPDTSCDMRRS